MPQSQILELTHEKLGWPESGEIWKPSGAGPEVYAGLATQKHRLRLFVNLPDPFPISNYFRDSIN